MKTIEQLQEEVFQLQLELQQRDLLVQQLSEELFRLVKGNLAFVPSQQMNDKHEEEMRSLSRKLEKVEEQLSASQEEINERDREIVELRHTVQELTDRTRTLEQAVQELPNIYRAKFAERMVPIKSKVEMLHKENRQLHIELQSLSYRLATYARPQRVELPKVQTVVPALPVLSNA